MTTETTSIESATESPLIQLIYVSSATQDFTEAELKELLELSRQKNGRLGISGLLLYKDGNFIQVLEGPEESVLDLYQRIQKDPRHSNLLTLVHQAIDQRQFADWSMGFHNLNQLKPEDLPGFSPFLTEPLTPQAFQQNPGRATTLLLTFKRITAR